MSSRAKSRARSAKTGGACDLRPGPRPGRGRPGRPGPRRPRPGPGGWRPRPGRGRPARRTGPPGRSASRTAGSTRPASTPPPRSMRARAAGRNRAGRAWGTVGPVSPAGEVGDAHHRRAPAGGVEGVAQGAGPGGQVAAGRPAQLGGGGDHDRARRRRRRTGGRRRPSAGLHPAPGAQGGVALGHRRVGRPGAHAHGRQGARLRPAGRGWAWRRCRRRPSSGRGCPTSSTLDAPGGGGHAVGLPPRPRPRHGQPGRRPGRRPRSPSGPGPR